MKIAHKLCYLTAILFMIFSQLSFGGASATTVNPTTPLAPGDDPRITITSPQEIGANARAVLMVTLAASSGRLNEDGEIKVLIPKNIVRDSTGQDIINSTNLGGAFYWGTSPLTDDGAGNWVLRIQYDHTRINQGNAFSSSIYVNFQAPAYWSTDPNAPNSADFSAHLSNQHGVLSSDQASSTVGRLVVGRPHFTKQSDIRKDTVNNIPDVSMLSTNAPSSNVFAILVNYNEQNWKNVVVSDIIPKDTSLTDPNEYVRASGDATVIDHFRIAKVTSWNGNVPQTFEYVTQNFKGSISRTSDGFSVNLGDIKEAYVIMYGQKVDAGITPAEFGVRYNQATLSVDGNETHNMSIPVALDKSSFDQIELSKTVNQATLSTTSGEIIYSLTLNTHYGSLPAGTIVTDPLPNHVTYLDTIKLDSNYFSQPFYDKSSNTVTYTLLKDLNAGESSSIDIKTFYENLNAQPNDRILNKAYYSYHGSHIYSDDAVTTLDGSAYLYKTDADSKDPLAGAEFKIVDNNGLTVVENLVSDDNGFINSGILPPGDYQFIEVKAPNGYTLNPTPIDFTIKLGQKTPVNLSVTNQLKGVGSVELTKVDRISRAVLAGAKFELQDANGLVIQSDLVTNEFGTISVNELDPGNYQFVETKAPQGYQLDSTPVTFTIKAGESETVKVIKENTPILADEPIDDEVDEPIDDEIVDKPIDEYPGDEKPIVDQPAIDQPIGQKEGHPSADVSMPIKNNFVTPAIDGNEAINQIKPTKVSIKKTLPQTGDSPLDILLLLSGISFSVGAIYLLRRNR
ncbi:LPXTG cell wall anchor domain-containing protein [Listeria rocourtiae]|uniref:LPXTG cell wall anchor domain-containing protein n=1 Tax=Listeria rocourtiae TaxID=647910 RepID=UPI001626F230|nr:LPXTG cell wall anchor domain-containing protein [Listeria rocourtiae]MBC1606085.1 LPXTG cell wall anchor domain-containing protein [Listeria rocourtiae]